MSSFDESNAAARIALASQCDTLSLDEAASIMRLGVDAARELVLAGVIPAVTLNKKHMVLLREDVIEFLRETARRQQAERKARVQRPVLVQVSVTEPPEGSRRGRARNAPPRLADVA